MAAIMAEKHFKKKTFALETTMWGPYHKTAQPEPPPVEELQPASKLENLEEEFTFTIKTEPEDFVFEPLESEVDQNLEMLMEFPEQAVLKFESKDEEDNEHRKDSVEKDFGSLVPRWQCEICSKIVSTKNSYLDHMKAMHEEVDESEMHKCDLCNKLFKVRNYFNTHMRRVHGKVSKTRERKPRIRGLPRPKPLGTLNKVDKQVNKKEIQHCEPCKKIFTTRKSYQDHVKTKHEYVDPEDMFVCDHCGKRQVRLFRYELYFDKFNFSAFRFSSITSSDTFRRCTLRFRTEERS